MWLWEAHFDIHRVPSLFTLEINRWKVKENKWEERWERGRAQTALCHAETYLLTVFFKMPFLWEQLFGSQQAVVRGKYIRPDLVCFGCFGDAAIMRDRGLVIEQGRFFFCQPSCAHFFQLARSFCTFYVLSCLILSSAGIKLHYLFFSWMNLISFEYIYIHTWRRSRCYTCGRKIEIYQIKKLIFKGHWVESLIQTQTQSSFSWKETDILC